MSISRIAVGTSAPRVAPFALFMLFIGLDELLHLLRNQGLIDVSDTFFLYLYPIKISLVGLTLWLWRSAYTEIDVRDLWKFRTSFISLIAGLVVFVLWIWMIWPFAIFGNLTGFDPSIFVDDRLKYFMITVRLIGAVIIVPIMEELFWRSFLIRYLTGPSFMGIRIGQMTVTSFIVTTVLFGLEHNLWLAGMTAGAAYNLLLLHTRSIAQCIIAHAATNAFLGIYVLMTKQWFFW
jgi:uncharacterized protein